MPKGMKFIEMSQIRSKISRGLRSRNIPGKASPKLRSRFPKITGVFLTKADEDARWERDVKRLREKSGIDWDTYTG